MDPHRGGVDSPESSLQDEHDVLHELIGSSDDDGCSSEAEGAESETCTHDSCSDSSVILDAASSPSPQPAPLIAASSTSVPVLAVHTAAPARTFMISSEQMEWYNTFALQQRSHAGCQTAHDCEMALELLNSLSMPNGNSSHGAGMSSDPK